MNKVRCMFLAITIVAGCGGPGPQQTPVAPDHSNPQSEPPVFKAVRSGQDFIFAWSLDESFLLFKSASSADSRRYALEEMSQKSRQCQEPPCGELLPASSLKDINQRFAQATEWNTTISGRKAWVSTAHEWASIRC